MTVRFADANNPMCIIRTPEDINETVIEEIKSDKMPIDEYLKKKNHSPTTKYKSAR